VVDKTALHLTANSLAAVKCILAADEGLDPNVTDRGDRTPLWEAVSGSHYESAQYLLSLGADLNIKTCLGKSPPLLSVKNGDLKMIEILCKGSEK
jgi:ankyrin repeat protein